MIVLSFFSPLSYFYKWSGMYRRFQSTWEIWDVCLFFLNWAAGMDPFLIVRGLFSNLYCKVFVYYVYDTAMYKIVKVLMSCNIEEIKCFLNNTNIWVNFCVC